jgi:hypothetical protein
MVWPRPQIVCQKLCKLYAARLCAKRLRRAVEQHAASVRNCRRRSTRLAALQRLVRIAYHKGAFSPGLSPYLCQKNAFCLVLPGHFSTTFQPTVHYLPAHRPQTAKPPSATFHSIHLRRFSNFFPRPLSHPAQHPHLPSPPRSQAAPSTTLQRSTAAAVHIPSLSLRFAAHISAPFHPSRGAIIPGLLHRIPSELRS